MTPTPSPSPVLTGLDPAVALDGWVGAAGGAVIGAVVSVLIAVCVLRRTLRHEREIFVTQLASERELVLEQHRLEAFGELTAALLSFSKLDVSKESTEARFQAVLLAYHQWSLYVPDTSSVFREHVNFGLATVRETAEKAWRLGGDTRGAEIQFGTENGISAVSWIVSNGRVWHLSPENRSGIEEAIRKRFPARFSADVEVVEGPRTADRQTVDGWLRRLRFTRGRSSDR